MLWVAPAGFEKHLATREVERTKEISIILQATVGKIPQS